MRPVIGLNGEIEIDKGGPGSGPRPGNGSGPFKVGQKVMAGGRAGKITAIRPTGVGEWEHDVKFDGHSSKSEVIPSDAGSYKGSELKAFMGTRPAEHENNSDSVDRDIYKKIDFTGEVVLEKSNPSPSSVHVNRPMGNKKKVKKGGPGSGPRPGNGSNRYEVQQKGPHGYKAHHVVDTMTGQTVSGGIHMNSETAHTHAATLNNSIASGSTTPSLGLGGLM